MVPRILLAVSVLCTFVVAVFAAGLPKYVLDSKAQCYSLLDPANDEPVLYFGALGDASYSALTWHESSIGFYGSPGHDDLVRAKFTAEGVMFKIRHYSSDSSLHDVGFARHKRCNLVLDADPELPVSGSVEYDNQADGSFTVSFSSPEVGVHKLGHTACQTAGAAFYRFIPEKDPASPVSLMLVKPNFQLGDEVGGVRVPPGPIKTC